jgi:hypothetical protein
MSADNPSVPRCANCGNPFKKRHPSQRFHSRRCKDAYWNRVNPRGYGLLNADQVRAESDDDVMASIEDGWDGHKEITLHD